MSLEKGPETFLLAPIAMPGVLGRQHLSTAIARAIYPLSLVRQLEAAILKPLGKN